MMLLNKRIDDEVAREVYEYLVKNPNKAEFIISGIGGNVNDALAIADLIIWHGNCIGIAASQVNSSHMDVFMACQQRYYLPNAVLGYHHISHHIDGYAGPKEITNTLSEHTSYEKRYIDLYVSSSNLEYKDWKRMLDYVGDNGVGSIGPFEMKQFGIAKPFQEYLASKESFAIY